MAEHQGPADDGSLADDIDLGGEPDPTAGGSGIDALDLDDFELESGQDEPAPDPPTPPAQTIDGELEIGEPHMPDRIKSLFTPLGGPQKAIEDIAGDTGTEAGTDAGSDSASAAAPAASGPAGTEAAGTEAAAAADEAVAPAAALSPEEVERQREFESQITAPAIPDAVRPKGDTGWVSASGVSISPEGFEIDWSPSGRLVVAALEEALNTPQCTEIHGYAHNAFSAKVLGENAALQGLHFADNEEYLSFVEMLVTEAGGELAWRELKQSSQGVLQMRDGSRLMVLLPPATPFANFSIRKHTAKNWQPTQFVANGTMSQTILDFLRACVAARINIMIVGEAGSGKTTLLRALANSAMGDNERLAVAEQVPELMLTKPLAIPVAYSEVADGQTLVDRLEVLLYGGIDRLIVGEIHFRGITRMLETMMVTKGSISTYHARTAMEAGERMRLALQMENPNLHAEAAAKVIRETIELVVVLAELDGRHRVVQVMEVDWRSTGGGSRLAGNDLFAFDQSEGRFKGVNPPDPKGHIMGRAREHHVYIASEWFHDPEALRRLTGDDLGGRKRR